MEKRSRARLSGWRRLVGLVLATAPGMALAHSGSAELQQFTSGGHVIGFEKTGYVVTNGSYALRVEFEGARAVAPRGEGRVPEAEPAAGTPAPLGRVVYKDLWEGVDGIYDAVGGILRSTWEVAPGADPSAIRLKYNVPVEVTPQGELALRFETGAMTESRPIAWQEIDGVRHPVEVAFAKMGESQIGFMLGEYRRELPLTIDPALTWNTFLGGEGDDIIQHIVVDEFGSLYVMGMSNTSWGEPIMPHSGTWDVFVAKLTEAGVLSWLTFLGSNDIDEGAMLLLSPGGVIFAAGNSQSGWGTPIRDFSNPGDAFVAALGSDGSLAWLTFLGGFVAGIALDESDEPGVIAIGRSNASWGSPLNPYVEGSADCYMAKVTYDGLLAWNTFFALTNVSNLQFAVRSSSTEFTIGGLKRTWLPPYWSRPFLAKVDIGGFLVWETAVGNDGDWILGIDVSAEGDVYITGQARSSWGSPLQAFPEGAANSMFIAKLNSSGVLDWSTFMGGASQGRGIAVAPDERLFAVGSALESWGEPVFPFTGSSVDAFIVRLDSNGAVDWHGYIGGLLPDVGTNVTVDRNGSLIVVGITWWIANAPHLGDPWGSPIRGHSGNEDGFVARVPADPPPIPTTTSTMTATSTLLPTASRTPTPTPLCGDGFVGPGEDCDDGNNLDGDCCDADCNYEVAGAPCDDGDSFTCPDTCDGAGVCVGGNDESPACPNSCCDGIDNNGDGLADLEDENCGLGGVLRFAVVTTSDKPNAIRMGGRVDIDSVDIEVERADCDDPLVYRSQAGICGERMSLRKGGEAGFVASLGVQTGKRREAVDFGKGFDIRSHWVSNGLPVSAQIPLPIVGPGTCSTGGETCLHPLMPLSPSDPCPSDSVDACCPEPSDSCVGRRDLFDVANLYVVRNGEHPDYGICAGLRTELALDAARVAELTPNHPVYNNTSAPLRLRVNASASLGDCAWGSPNACTAACASACTVTVGAGRQVLYVDAIDVKRGAEFRICRDFSLTEADDPTTAIVRVRKNLKVGANATVRACGLDADSILWNAEGTRGSVGFTRGANVIGTVLAAERRSIKFGGDAELRGSLFAPTVNFSKFTELKHFPFTGAVD